MQAVFFLHFSLIVEFFPFRYNKNMSQRKAKKPKISSKAAFILSSVFIVLCVAMLFLSISLTKQDELTKASLSSSAVEAAEGKAKTKRPPVSTKEPDKKQTPTFNSDELPKIDSEKIDVTEGKTSGTSENLAEKPLDKIVSDKQSASATSETNSKYKIYIVLDDGGHNVVQLQPFLELSFPFAVAVLPHLAHSKDSAQRIVLSGKTLMLHQPMQAINRSVDPGPGALEPEFSPEKIRSIIKENIADINSSDGGNGKLVGMNNHEGSLITENAEIMKIVLQVCQEDNIFFLDSRTNVASVCKKVADELGMPIYERNIFLDNTPNQDDMVAQFRRGVEYAKKTGSVIMIGHVWSGKNLADVLQKMYSEYSPQGFEFAAF